MAIFVLSAFCVSGNLGAMNIYNAMSNGIISFGELIEKPDNLPLIGKLTNMLPFGMVATSCKEYPGQTMLLCAGLLYYILSNNEKAVALFNSCKDSIFAKFGINRKYDVHLDDTLFVFDGDDEEDAQEQMDTEDELLADDFSDVKRNRNINFL
jgi:hypothetical protein